MIFPVTTACLVGLIVWVWRFDGRRSGILLALYAWVLSLTLAALPIVSYDDVTYSMKTDLFVAACLLAVTIGYWFVRRPGRTPPAPVAGGVDRSLGRLLGIAGCVGSVLLLLNALRNGVHFSPSFLSQNLQSLRNDSFDAQQTGTGGGPLVIVGSLLAPAGYAYIVVAAWWNCGGRRDGRALALANFVLIILVALFVTTGRQPIAIACLMFAVGIWLRGGRLLRLKISTGFVIVVTTVAGWYFVTTFATERAGAGTDPQILLKIGSRAEYSPTTAAIVGGHDALGALVFQYSYISSPLPGLAWYVEHGPIPGPFYGQYSFPLPAVVATTVLGSHANNQWSDTRREVFAPFEESGYLGNVWTTLPRDLLVDFGFAGAVIFCLLLGMATAWSRNAFERSGRVFCHVFEVYAVVAVAFGAFQSLLYLNFFAYGLYGSFAMLLVTPMPPRMPVPDPSPSSVPTLPPA